MSNLVTTYQHIADILSFETSNHQLSKVLSQPSFDWDTIVSEGSRHLVLPTIYCRLKAKQLLNVLPEELNNYLEEITSINRNRNKAILKQINFISKILNENNINYVFLKGSTLIANDYYEDIAERMIGDIDILVAIDQLSDAYNLLKNNHYQAKEKTLGNKFFEHKHLPRLTSKEHICAVELHSRLFVSYKAKELKPENVLNEKINESNIFTPSPKHLLIHNILNFQINDRGALFNSISFRSSYDTIILLRKYTISEKIRNEKILKSYFKYSSLFFNDIRRVTKVKSNLLTSFYLFKLNHIKFYKIWNNLLLTYNLIPLLTKRLFYFVYNKSYRKEVIKDKKRIFTYIRSIFNNI